MKDIYIFALNSGRVMVSEVVGEDDDAFLVETPLEITETEESGYVISRFLGFATNQMVLYKRHLDAHGPCNKRMMRIYTKNATQYNLSESIEEIEFEGENPDQYKFISRLTH